MSSNYEKEMKFDWKVIHWIQVTFLNFLFWMRNKVFILFSVISFNGHTGVKWTRKRDIFTFLQLHPISLNDVISFLYLLHLLVRFFSSQWWFFFSLLLLRIKGKKKKKYNWKEETPLLSIEWKRKKVFHLVFPSSLIFFTQDGKNSFIIFMIFTLMA